MRIKFIRHGKTAGNLEKRYIGSTDEPLCSEGINELEKIKITCTGMLFSSPMIRCIQTAEILFPECSPIVINELRECDFGRFEGKNYIELSGDADYQSLIDSGGEKAFPGGETPDGFKKRCVEGFRKAVEICGCSGDAVFIVHGGTIMAVMEHYAVPKRSFYDRHTENGHGYDTVFDGKKIIVTEKI